MSVHPNLDRCNRCTHFWLDHSDEDQGPCDVDGCGCAHFIAIDRQIAALERIAAALEILAWIEGQKGGIYRHAGALIYLSGRMDALAPTETDAAHGGDADAH